MALKIKLASVVFLGVILCTSSVFAAWWDPKSIPTPSGVEEVKQEKRLAAGAEKEFTYYITDKSIEDISGFYRQQLPRLGWKENDLGQAMQKVSGNKDQEAMAKMLRHNLLFEKGSEQLIVTFLPAEASRDGRLRFTVVSGKAASPEAIEENEGMPAQLLTKPKKELFPAYPGASLLSLSQEKQYTHATYMSRDGIDNIYNFYKSQMPGFGWSLESESAPVRLNQEQPATDTDFMELVGAELNFTNTKGNLCSVILSQATAKKEQPVNLDMTTIMVKYAEK